MCGWRSVWCIVALAGAGACAAPPPSATVAPRASASSVHAVATPAPVIAPTPQRVPDERLSLEELPPELPELDGSPKELPKAPAGVAGEPTHCRALLTPATARACENRDAAVLLLADALAGKEALRSLESCQGFPPGFVRAVRAELDRSCSETLAAPLLQRPPPGISAELVHTLRGLALASRFVRAVPPAPSMPEPVDAARIDAFVAGALTRHRDASATRIDELSRALESLPEQSHGRAVALAGRAAAWQLLRGLRGQNLPVTLKKTYTLRARYFERVDALIAELDENAAVSTREATEAASLHGLLGDRALEQHLSLVRPANRLRWLALPRPAPAPRSESPWFRIAARLPARYPAELLSAAELASSRMLAELAPGGLSLRQKRALSRVGTAGELRVLAELRLKLALVLYRVDQLREASRLAELVEQPTSRDLLLLAVIRDLLRTSANWETATAVPTGFVPSALLALADAPDEPEAIRSVASYDAAVLLSVSERISTLQAAYRRLQTVRSTAPDRVLADCAGAFQHELSDTWRFEPVPPCRNWPWRDN